MDVREALYTTRAMRRVKPDPIPDDVQARILDAAIRAPSGGNAQGWRFLIMDDKEQIAKIEEPLGIELDSEYRAFLARLMKGLAEGDERRGDVDLLGEVHDRRGAEGRAELGGARGTGGTGEIAAATGSERESCGEAADCAESAEV